MRITSMRATGLGLLALLLSVAVLVSETLASDTGETPGSPANLQAASTAEGISLTWDAPAGDNITGYQIVRRRPLENERQLIVYVEDTASTATAYTDTGVVDGTVYVYRVLSRNQHGVGARSNFVRLKYRSPVKPPPAPAAVTGLAANTVSMEIQLQWNADDNAQGYGIDRREMSECGSAFEPVESDTGGTATSWTDEDVEHGRKYRYRVRAISSDGNGRWSKKVTLVYENPDFTGRTGNNGTSGLSRPTNLVARSAPEGISLAWDAQGKGSPTGYLILRRMPNQCQANLLIYVADTGNTQTAYLDTGTEVGEVYVYRVVARNGGGYSEQSKYSRITRAPVDDDSNGDGGSSSTGGSGSTPPTRGGEEPTPIPTPEPTPVPSPPASPPNQGGTGGGDDATIKNILPPTDVTARVMTGGVVRLSWTAPPGREPDGYQILRRSPTKGESELSVYMEDTGSSTTEWTDTGVESHTEYIYRVSTYDPAGTGVLSQPASVETRDLDNPTVIILFGMGDDEVLPHREMVVWVSVNYIPEDDDSATLDAVVRIDVEDSDGVEATVCEGNGIGTDHELYTVEGTLQAFEVVFGGDGCTVGEYKILVEVAGSGEESMGSTSIGMTVANEVNHND